jgi:DNA modification methylase
MVKEAKLDEPGHELLLKYYRDLYNRTEGGKRLSFKPEGLWQIPTKNKFLQSYVSDDNKEIRKMRKKISPKSGLSKEYPFSEFKPDVMERLVEFYSSEGDTIVDPYSGRATRGIIAGAWNRKYIGFDVDSKTVAHNATRFQELTEDLLQFNSERGKEIFRPSMKMIHGDGTKIEEIDNESADCIITCPPYGDVEVYSGEGNDLSHKKTYNEFLEWMETSAQNCFRVLKWNKFCIFVVGDWRNKNPNYSQKKYLDFSGDLIRIFESAGFTLHDKFINRLYTPFNFLGASQCKVMRYTTKCIEFMLVFTKGDLSKWYKENEFVKNFSPIADTSEYF